MWTEASSPPRVAKDYEDTIRISGYSGNEGEGVGGYPKCCSRPQRLETRGQERLEMTPWD